MRGLLLLNPVLLLIVALTVQQHNLATAQELPNCTDVGVYLCYNSNADDLCDDYCRSQGSVKNSCEIFDDSLRVTCQCASSSIGCFDVPEYNSSNIPTCTEFGIYSCNNACTDICRSLANTRGDGEGRVATCIAPGRGNTKCMCDGLAVCDDAVDLGPTTAPTQSPGTLSGGTAKGGRGSSSWLVFSLTTAASFAAALLLL
eukprot:scaffold1637_cov108-Cylindrotheca_fusiformis.AAC.6